MRMCVFCNWELYFLLEMCNMVSEVNWVEVYEFEMANCQLPPPDPMVCAGNLSELESIHRRIQRLHHCHSTNVQRRTDTGGYIEDDNGKRLLTNSFATRAYWGWQEKADKNTRDYEGHFVWNVTGFEKTRLPHTQ